MGKGGKGPGGTGGGLSGTTVGMIALFAGLIVVMGGLAIGDSLGWFGAGGATQCDTLEGRQVHEHATVLVFLEDDQEEPFDFSPPRYQVQEGFLHFENGRNPPDRMIHIHEARPTLGCMFGTINWQVSEDRIVTDTGEEYVAEDGYEIRFLVNGEPAMEAYGDVDNGIEVPLVQGNTYEVHHIPEDQETPDTSQWWYQGGG